MFPFASVTMDESVWQAPRLLPGSWPDGFDGPGLCARIG